MAECHTESSDGPVLRGPSSWARHDAELTATRHRLIRWAIQLVWNRDDAEEIVQEAFRLAFQHGIRPGEPRFGPWMHRTVGRLGLNRRRRRRQEPLADWMEPVDAGSDCDPEQLERLRAAIERLPEQQRLALLLRTMERMDYDAIGQILEVSAVTARTHVHHAKAKLAEWLGET